jgi:hypothetical protein
MDMDSDETRVSLIVMEAGAGWPEMTGAHHAPNSVVEAQLAGEAPEDFAARVKHRMSSLDGPIVFGLIATNGNMDPAALELREDIARAACRHMASAEGGELLLVADESVADGVRHGLMALAGALCGELAGDNVSVRVRFPETRSESGVVPTAPVVEPVVAETG